MDWKLKNKSQYLKDCFHDNKLELAQDQEEAPKSIGRNTRPRADKKSQQGNKENMISTVKWKTRENKYLDKQK